MLALQMGVVAYLSRRQFPRRRKVKTSAIRRSLGKIPLEYYWAPYSLPICGLINGKCSRDQGQFIREKNVCFRLSDSRSRVHVYTLMSLRWVI